MFRILSSVLRTPTQFSCVVPARTFATKGDAEIVKFLAEEIASEKQNQKPLTKLEGWEVNTKFRYKVCVLLKGLCRRYFK